LRQISKATNHLQK